MKFIDTFLNSLEITGIVLASLGILLLIVGIVLVIVNKKSANKLVKEEKIEVNHNEILEAIGGVSNLVSSTLNGSRLTLILKDYSIVKKEILKKYGIDRTLEMSNKLILIGETVQEIDKNLKNV